MCLNDRLQGSDNAREDLFAESDLKPWSADLKTITLTPAATGTDGFFLAVMQRRD